MSAKKVTGRRVVSKTSRWGIDVPVTIPTGESGEWRIIRFRVDHVGAQLHNLRELLHRSSRVIQPGMYTRLERKGQWDPVMSDTPAERRDHHAVVMMATGHVLVTGLGIGFVIAAIARKPGVDSITVVEKSAEVSALVAPHYLRLFGERLTIVEDDAFTWRPRKGQKFNVIWHDIWNTLSSDNLREMQTLKRRYRRYLAPGGWQGCWCEAECRRMVG